MLDFTIYGADCVGNSGNCLYPNKMVVTDKASLYRGNEDGSCDGKVQRELSQ